MSKGAKKENLRKMIKELEVKIEKLQAQKHLYELSLTQFSETSGKDET